MAKKLSNYKLLQQHLRNNKITLRNNLVGVKDMMDRVHIYAQYHHNLKQLSEDPRYADTPALGRFRFWNNVRNCLNDDYKNGKDLANNPNTLIFMPQPCPYTME